MLKLPSQNSLESRYWESKFEIWSTFVQNRWTLTYFFQHSWKALKQGYKTTKFGGPKFKNKIWLQINIRPPSAHTRRNARTEKDYIEIEYLTWYSSTRHLSSFHTHSIWQPTLHAMLYKSIMHHTIHFLHTQHMAGDVPHHALWQNLSIFHTQHMVGDATHHAFDAAQHALSHTASHHFLYTHHMAGEASHHAPSNTASLYHPYTQHMAGDATHGALWKYHAPHPLFYTHTHTAYGRWCYTPCSIAHCTPPFSIHTACGRIHPYHAL